MVHIKPANIGTINVGDSASCCVTVTEQHVESFACLSGDANPLHTNDEFAQQRGFPSRVAHGMIALSTISRLIGTQLPGAGSLWISQDVQFVVPVQLDDTLEACVTVEKISKAAQIVVLATEAVNTRTNAIVLRGTAKVRIPPQKDNDEPSDSSVAGRELLVP